MSESFVIIFQQLHVIVKSRKSTFIRHRKRYIFFLDRHNLLSCFFNENWEQRIKISGKSGAERIKDNNVLYILVHFQILFQKKWNIRNKKYIFGRKLNRTHYIFGWMCCLMHSGACVIHYFHIFKHRYVPSFQ